jgi:hypothetical protein
MREKVDVWVVVRFDEPTPDQADFVAIKGVYDSFEEAIAASDRAAKESAQRARYTVVRSRRFLAEGGAATSHDRHQARWEKSLKMWQHTSQLLPGLMKPALTELASQLPPEVSRRAFQPLLAYYAEALVGRALNATPVREPSIQGDVRLPNGDIVEVKSVLLEPDRRKAPVVQFRTDRTQQLALVLFSNDLKVIAARLIPSSVLSHFDRLGTHSRQGQFSNIRITPDLLDAPGTTAIELPPISDVSPRRDVAIEEIKTAVHKAAGRKQKIAMFHLQVLRHAEELDGVNAKAFCRELAVPETYATEFTKMLSLAKLMKEEGLKII